MTLIREQQIGRASQAFSASLRRLRAMRTQCSCSQTRAAELPVRESNAMNCREQERIFPSLYLHATRCARCKKTQRDVRLLGYVHQSTSPAAELLLDSHLPLPCACPPARHLRKLLLLYRRLCLPDQQVHPDPNGLPDRRKTTITVVLAMAGCKDGALRTGPGPHLASGYTSRRATLLTRASSSMDCAGRACTPHRATCAPTMLHLWRTEDAPAFIIAGPMGTHTIATHFPSLACLPASERAIKIEALLSDKGSSLIQPTRNVVKQEQADSTLGEAMGEGLPLIRTLIGNHLHRQYDTSCSQDISTTLQPPQATNVCLNFTSLRHPDEWFVSQIGANPSVLRSTPAASDSQPAEGAGQALSILLVVSAEPHGFSGTARRVADCSTESDANLQLAGSGCFNRASRSLFTSVLTFAKRQSTCGAYLARETSTILALLETTSIIEGANEPAGLKYADAPSLPTAASPIWLNASSVWRQSHLLAIQTFPGTACALGTEHTSGRSRGETTIERRGHISAEQSGEKFCQGKGISQRRNRHESGQISTAATDALD